MKFWWIIGRTLLFALLMMSTTLLYVGSMEITKYGASEQGNTLIIILKIVAIVFGVSLVIFERKYSNKFQLKGTVSIIVSEIVLLIIVAFLFSFYFIEIESYIEKYLHLGTPMIISLTFLSFVVIAILPSTESRKKLT